MDATQTAEQKQKLKSGLKYVCLSALSIWVSGVQVYVPNQSFEVQSGRLG